MMQRGLHHFATPVPVPGNAYLVCMLFLANLIFNIIGNSAFKLSAAGDNWRTFIAWQLVGNLAGLITVLSLTGLLRFIPLHVAFPITAGLAVIGIQVVAASFYFSEAISPRQWLGTLLVVMGIFLIGKK